MFSLKRTALRLLSSPSTSFVSKPRSISTISPLTTSYRLSQPTSSLLSRRWNSTSADQQESDAVTSAINAASEQSTSKTEDLEAIAESQAEAPVAPAAEEEPVPAPRVTEAAPAAETYESNPFQAQAPPTRRPRRSEERAPRGQKNTNPKPEIYVGNLFFDVTTDELKAMAEKFGTVVSTRLIYDSKGLSKGFGYVQFENTESATRAIEELHMSNHEGRRIVVSYAHTTRSSLNNGLPPSNTLFVGNMAYEMTDRDLRDLFRGIDGVRDVRVAVDRRTGQPRGFCHAQFSSTELATKGMEILKHKMVYGRRLRLDFSAPSKDQMSLREKPEQSNKSEPVETQEQAEQVKEETEDVKVQV